MGKNKLKKFAENLTFRHLIQPDLNEVLHTDHPMKGNWKKQIFGNENPIILELGCGRGEYTIGLSRLFKEKNFIGVDIKGARLWRGAKTVEEEKISNAAFLRTRIECITSFFATGEVDEIWLTFPDPQLKERRAKKRLTSPSFLEKYKLFLCPKGPVNLKTDSAEMAGFTNDVIRYNQLTVLYHTDDLYSEQQIPEELHIITGYEKKFLEEGKKIHYIRFLLDNQKPLAYPY